MLYKHFPKKNKFYLILSIMLLTSILFLHGCGDKPGDNGDDEKSQTYVFKIYYVNSEYVETGDESLGVYAMNAREVEVDKDENPWIVMFEELKHSGVDELWSAIDGELIFNDVYADAEDPTLLYVDLSNVQGGGSFVEGLFIGQIVRTAIANSDVLDGEYSVEKVKFLIDGEPTESLMGHYESIEPFGMEDI